MKHLWIDVTGLRWFNVIALLPNCVAVPGNWLTLLVAGGRFVLLFGGASLALVLAIAPVAGIHACWWVPLPNDPGCVLITTLMLIWPIIERRRARKPQG
jgi:hypothetical protein